MFHFMTTMQSQLKRFMKQFFFLTYIFRYILHLEQIKILMVLHMRFINDFMTLAPEDVLTMLL